MRVRAQYACGWDDGRQWRVSSTGASCVRRGERPDSGRQRADLRQQRRTGGKPNGARRRARGTYRRQQRRISDKAHRQRRDVGARYIEWCSDGPGRRQQRVAAYDCP